VTRAELVAAARASIARGSKSFGLASRLFAPEVRERAWLLYAWCRRCDDLADGQEAGHDMAPVADPAARLALIRTLTDRALAGEATGDPAFDALGVVARECAIPAGYAHDLVAGFALDAEGWRPADEADLLRYCYHVAGVVGIMMALLMGVRADEADTLSRASDLGLAFQLANIARDVAEDARNGRCYLPAAWLAEVGVAPDALLAPESRAGLAALLARLAAMAERYEASARIGAARLPFRSRWAVLAAAGIYGGIAREVARRGESALDARVTTGKVAKLGWVAKALVAASRAMPGDEEPPPPGRPTA
jgi:15-cis-phytoene synthase